jgi:hypothetical protein
MRETVVNTLRDHPFVAEFDPRHVETLAKLGKEIRFERDRILFGEGDECSEFHLIVTGLVALEIAAPEHTFSRANADAAARRGCRRAAAADPAAASRYLPSDRCSRRSATAARDRGMPGQEATRL